ncbi:MAG: LysR family transcriptional regulator [Gammaproteobacteria bacterium]|nr:LysR family transcriptional regulator [Gammaproteobacteria bacterium]
MDTELLKTFLEVQKTRHFGKAADNLYLTQSAVSFRIRQLEQSLGVTLFNRFRNNIQLTTAGEMLLPHAQAVLNAIASAKQQIALSYHPDKPLQLSLSTELSVLFAAPAFSQFVTSEHQCQLQLMPTDLLGRQSQQVQDGMVLLGNQLPEPQPLQALCLGYLELVAVSAIPSGQLIEGSLGQAQIPRIHQSTIQFSCADPTLLLQWVLVNHASAYLPMILVEDAIAQKRLERLPFPELRLPVWAYSKSDATWPGLWRTTLQGNTVLREAC